MPTQGALDHHLRQLAQQAVLAGQLQPASPRPRGQFPQHLLVSGRKLHQLVAESDLLLGRYVRDCNLNGVTSGTEETPDDQCDDQPGPGCSGAVRGR
jgi:hypothetical protein